MKTTNHIKSTLVASLSLLCACTSSLDEVTGQPDPVSFSLSVSVDNYAPAGGGAETRAADAYPVTFANGDRLGLTALDVSGNIVTGYNNVPFTYKDGKWSPTASVPFSAAYQYLVYYPYQEAMSDKTTKEAIIAAASPLADQRSEAAYRASDLLVCDPITPQAGDKTLKTLNVAFQHAFSLLVIPAIKATVTSEGVAYQCGLPVIDPGITVGTEVYLPYVAPGGTARCVVKPQSYLSLKGYFSCDGKLYSSRASSVTLAANCYYAFKELNTNVTYGFDRAQAGDFYCSAAEGKGYLIPYNAVSLPIDANCIGVVFWVGDITGEDPLLKTQHPTYTHGLVVALQDAVGNSLWSSSYEDITDKWLNSQSATYGITSLKESDKMQGYANTQALKDYNTKSSNVQNNSNLKVLPIEAITTTYAAAHPAPASSSSGWYFPSVKELKYMYWGQGATSQSTAGRDFLNAQLGKVSGTSLQSLDSYWSSTETDNSWAWYVHFSGRVYYYGSKNSHLHVRAVLAF